MFTKNLRFLSKVFCYNGRYILAQKLQFSIITATYNQLEYTKLFLQSLRENSTYPYEIIVVDNGSNDGTQQWLEQQKIDKVIFWSENKGVTKAWNSGIRQARGEYICIINNDVIVSPKWMNGLINILDHAPNDLAALSPSSNDVFFKLDISPDQNGYTYFKETSHFFSSREKQLWPYCLIGSCIILTKKIIDKIGLFDEQFFAYYNDLDYNLSITSSGMKSYTTNQSIIYHFGGKSKNDISNEQKEQDKIKFLNKWSQMHHFLNQYFSSLSA